jgi:uncharacterized protein YycO
METRAPFEEVARHSVNCFAPGDDATHYRPADFILTHGDAFISSVIRFGQKIRIQGEDRKYAHWNHAALVVSETGDLIEARGHGVCRTHISDYTPKNYCLVRIQASAEDREHAVRFAEWAAGLMDSKRKQRYGFLTIASVIYTTLTGGKFTFAIDGQTICSGLVARAMERTGAIFNRTPSHLMPADLAKYYRVDLPSSDMEVDVSDQSDQERVNPVPLKAC